MGSVGILSEEMVSGAVRRKMEWAGRGTHLGGVPRKAVIAAVGAFAKVVASLLNSTSVHNADTLLRLVRFRPPGVPLITVSNHISTFVPIVLILQLIGLKCLCRSLWLYSLLHELERFSRCED